MFWLHIGEAGRVETAVAEKRASVETETHKNVFVNELQVQHKAHY